MMTIAASRLLKNGAVCFVGIGLPSTAANLARLTHAPDIVLIYESGPIGAKPEVLPLLLAMEIWRNVRTRSFLRRRFFAIGCKAVAWTWAFSAPRKSIACKYQHHGDRRLQKADDAIAGAGGAPEIASCAKEVVLVLKQSARTFVRKLDF